MDDDLFTEKNKKKIPRCGICKTLSLPGTLTDGICPCCADRRRQVAENDTVWGCAVIIVCAIIVWNMLT